MTSGRRDGRFPLPRAKLLVKHCPDPFSALYCRFVMESHRFDLDAELQRHFGHSGFREGQKQVVETLLAGRSALAVFPTGGGKSLCYQLPAILMEGVTLVVSPLIALMKDQVDALQQRGISAARLDSTLAPAEAAAIYEDLSLEKLKLLYIAPKRFVSETFVAKIKRARICLLAIDEAHCISEWGHNFRPEYLRLAALAKKFRIPRVLALTATATPTVSKEIREAFRIAKRDQVQTSFHRPNLALHITPVSADRRLDFAHRAPVHEETLSGDRLCHPPAHGRKRFREPAASGRQARAYHAGLANDVRSAAQDDFMQGRCDVDRATIAFGMGIDKADIRSDHFNLPKTLENYQQEIGRAGRDRPRLALRDAGVRRRPDCPSELHPRRHSRGTGSSPSYRPPPPAGR
jgi:ATP-dependent DNA helicase RecQ